VDREHFVEAPRVDLSDLLQRRSFNRLLLDAAMDPIAAFSASMGAVKHVIYMTDADGIVLYSCGTEFLMQSYGLRPGFDWSERAMGTNGAGTALACNAPVAVIGAEHWLEAFQNASCLAAPICGPDATPIAALDLSTHVADCDPGQLRAVIELAHEIERRMAG
jgi:transcriptional regulator of acetoin/glycerol metabolism